MSKSEKKFDEFEEIGKVDDSNIDDNFGESMKTITTSCFSVLSPLLIRQFFPGRLVSNLVFISNFILVLQTKKVFLLFSLFVSWSTTGELRAGGLRMRADPF